MLGGVASGEMRPLVRRPLRRQVLLCTLRLYDVSCDVFDGIKKNPHDVCCCFVPECTRYGFSFTQEGLFQDCCRYIVCGYFGWHRERMIPTVLCIPL